LRLRSSLELTYLGEEWDIPRITWIKRWTTEKSRDVLPILRPRPPLPLSRLLILALIFSFILVLILVLILTFTLISHRCRAR